MISGAVLVLEPLLILAGLAAARIPGEATFASSGISPFPETERYARQGPRAMALRARNPIRAFLLSPIHPTTWYANAVIGLGFFVGTFAFVTLVSFASAGLATLVTGIGVLLIVIVIEGSRLIARFERRRVRIADPRPLDPHPYRPLRGSIVDVIKAEFADENRWRDVLYVVVNFPLAILEFVVVVSLWALALSLLTMPLWYDAVPGSTLPGYLDWLSGRSTPLVVLRPLAGAVLLPVAASVSQLVMALHRAVASGLLCTPESRELRRQVETLKESRSAVLDVEASELRRIERDLHDGAQQRLVMLTIDLGLASERIDSDPEAARKLVLEGKEQARQALAELRDLVRGIAPRSSSIGASFRRSGRSRLAGRCRRSSGAIWSRASGCRPPSSGRLLRRRRGARQRRQAVPRVGWEADEIGADLPQAGGGRGVVGGRVGPPGLAVGEVAAGDSLHLGGAGQVDGGVGAPFWAPHERSQGGDHGGHGTEGVLRAEGGAGHPRVQHGRGDTCPLRSPGEFIGEHHVGQLRLAVGSLSRVLALAHQVVEVDRSRSSRVLDGIVDLVFSEIDLPAIGADWKTAMRQRAISVRDALARHRWAIGMMESRANPGPASLRHHDAVIGCLRAAGFDMAMAAHAYSLLDSYIYGFALTKMNLPFDTSDEVAEVAQSMLEPFPVNEYPNLVEFITEHAMKPGYDYADESEYGLDLILDGLARARDTG